MVKFKPDFKFMSLKFFSLFIYVFIYVFIYLFIASKRKQKHEWGRGRERGRGSEREFQAGSILSVQSQMQGLNSEIVRS